MGMIKVCDITSSFFFILETNKNQISPDFVIYCTESAMLLHKVMHLQQCNQSCTAVGDTKSTILFMTKWTMHVNNRSKRGPDVLRSSQTPNGKELIQRMPHVFPCIHNDAGPVQLQENLPLWFLIS